MATEAVKESGETLKSEEPAHIMHESCKTEAVQQNGESVQSEEPAHIIQESSKTETRPPNGEIQSRWKAGVHVPVNMPVDEVWAVFGDFANAQEFMTQCLECKIIEGEPNAVHCVRYLKGSNLDGSEGFSWAHERLLSNDDENHIQTYKIEDNSFGFVNYHGYLKVNRGNDDTSVVTWCLEMDPLPGMSPPPNVVTQMMTDTFRLFIKHVESKYLRRKGIEVESPAVGSATA